MLCSRSTLCSGQKGEESGWPTLGWQLLWMETLHSVNRRERKMGLNWEDQMDSISVRSTAWCLTWHRLTFAESSWVDDVVLAHFTDPSLFKVLLGEYVTPNLGQLQIQCRVTSDHFNTELVSEGCRPPTSPKWHTFRSTSGTSSTFWML